jgi:hypothetical protein
MDFGTPKLISFYIRGRSFTFCRVAWFIAKDSMAQDNLTLGFFITSAGPGNGADLGGLAGADAHCQSLAAVVGAGGRSWRAYLSAQASDDQEAVNARDRIGAGPWHNAEGVIVANNVDELHGDNNLTKETALNENDEVVNGRGDSPNRHDIMTGAQLDGTLTPGGMQLATIGPVAVTAVPYLGTTIVRAAATIQPRGIRRTARAAVVKAICKEPAATGYFTALQRTTPMLGLR